MYSQRIIAHNFSEGIRLGTIPESTQYATVTEAYAMTKQLEVKWDKAKGKITQPLTPEEVAFIQKERFLCRINFLHFSTRYCYIKNAFGEVVQFTPWISQLIFLDMLAEGEELGIALLILALKARQLGISRIAQLLMKHRVVFYPNVNCVVASSRPEKTVKLVDMLEFTFDRLPWWLVPEITSYVSGSLIEFAKQDSGISMQHGAQMSGIARGTTPTVFHLSELAEFLNAASIVDASLLRAVHDSPKTLGIFESTAEGQHNWWHKKWLSAKEGYPQGTSRLRPMFLPWFVGTDLYPTSAWLRQHPIPPNFLDTRADWLHKHIKMAENYVASNPYLQKYLGSSWTMSIEQQWFYQAERSQAMRENNLSTFLQEMPANDTEAFQNSNVSIFTNEVISHHRDFARAHLPTAVYGLVGPSDILPARLQPHHSQIDSNRPPITVPVPWIRSGPAINYTLVPLRWGGYDTDDGLGKIYIFEPPQYGQTYGFGLDTAQGVGLDRTVLQGIRKGTIYARCRQVCEFSSAYISATDSVPFAEALAAYYYVDQPDSIKRIPRMAIECKDTGEQAQLRLKLRGYSNFHPWQKVDDRQLDLSKYNKIGIYTNGPFRKSMIEFLTKMINDGHIEIMSPFTVSEMESLEIEEGVQSARAASGAHDDRIMSLACVVISLYQWEAGRNEIQTPVPQIALGETSIKRYASYTPNAQEKITNL